MKRGCRRQTEHFKRDVTQLAYNHLVQNNVNLIKLKKDYTEDLILIQHR